MYAWAEWRRTGEGFGTGSLRSNLGKFLDGMPSPKCIKCNGTGRIPSPDIEQNFTRISCDLCAGTGKVDTKSSEKKTNPAFIRATGYTPDDVSGSIEQAYGWKLTKRQKLVIQAEFLHKYSDKMSQEEKAAMIGDFHHSVYSRELKKSLLTIIEQLKEDGLWEIRRKN